MAGAASASWVRIAALQDATYSICASIALGVRDLGVAANGVSDSIMLVGSLSRFPTLLPSVDIFSRSIAGIFGSNVAEDDED